MTLTNLPNNYFRSIDDFILQEQGKPLGCGSFGIVRKAYHKITNKTYAIKIVNSNPIQVDIGDMEDNDPQLLLLQRQISIHYQLHHPHIVQLWAVITKGTKVYMIMECAENGNLFSLLTNTRLPQLNLGTDSSGKSLSELESFRIFSQVLEAVQYMHKMDVFHRDIKPENILLDQNYNIKLCDLGWVADEVDRKRTTFCGTYQYMAPEMVKDIPYDYKIDIWALGVLLFELTHGRPPFPADSLDDIKYKFQKGVYEVKENLSNEFKNLIVNILQFDPNKRISIADIKSSQWVEKFKAIYQKKIKMGMGSGQYKSGLLKVNKSNTRLLSKDKDEKVRKYHKKYHTLEQQDFENCHKNYKISKHGSIKSNLRYDLLKQNTTSTSKNWMPKENDLNVYLKEAINKIAIKQKETKKKIKHLRTGTQSNEAFNKKITKLIYNDKLKFITEEKKKKQVSKRS